MSGFGTVQGVNATNLNGGVRLTNVNWQHFQHHLVANARHLRTGAARMVEADTKRDKVVVLCGSGPSLKDHAAREIDRWPADVVEVWGCNNAAVWLTANKHRVTAGVGIGLEPAMIDEWAGVKRHIPFYLATHTHPSVVAELVDRGHPIRFFHSHVNNIDAELRLWRAYPRGIVVGIGLNVVTRAVALAYHMGYRKIVVLGADCALRGRSYYADDRSFSDVYKNDAQLLRAEIDGREWLTRPDMAITAHDLVQMLRMKETGGGRMELVGDTLPNAIREKDADWLKQMPHLENSRVTGFTLFRPYRIDPTDDGALEAHAGAAVTTSL